MSVNFLVQVKCIYCNCNNCAQINIYLDNLIKNRDSLLAVGIQVLVFQFCYFLIMPLACSI